VNILISILFLLFTPIIYFAEGIVIFPIGLLIVFPCLMLYKLLAKKSFYELDKVFTSTPFPLNIILSFWTNSREPMPAGGKRDLWKDKPEWYRYLRWHLRNPMSDFTHFVIGYYQYKDKAVITKIYKNKHLKPEIKKVPKFPYVFPRLDVYLFGYHLCIGYRDRGCLNLSLKKVED